MKQFFLVKLIAFALVACNGGNNNNNNNANQSASIATPKVKQLNISILLDLSDRISPKINPDAKKNDIENIKTITAFFREDMKRRNAYNAKGKIRIFLVPPPPNSNINSIVSKLNIDCSKMDNKGRKGIYDNLSELYTQNLDEIYDETIATSLWIGSDIWRFFKDDVRDYCVENDPDYRNVLIILTDGYLYYEQSKFKATNRFSYLLDSNLAKYRNQNWKLLIEQNDFGIMTERNDLNDLEVLVLEIKAEKARNRIDEDVLPFVLKKWFAEMNVSHYEVYHSDLPANIKMRIERFLHQ
jgi:hypothetical protein